VIAVLLGIAGSIFVNLNVEVVMNLQITMIGMLAGIGCAGSLVISQELRDGIAGQRRRAPG